jgi:hypothetical protein
LRTLNSRYWYPQEAVTATFLPNETRTPVQSPHTSQESLEQARILLRELIDRLQADAQSGQAPTSLLRLLVHIANIQRAVELSSEDFGNAVKRLRDFANTIERMDSTGTKSANSNDIRVQLVTVLRLAADQLSGPGAPANSAAGGEGASLGS